MLTARIAKPQANRAEPSRSASCAEFPPLASKPPVVSARLPVGQANDPLEHAADRTADAVTRGHPATGEGAHFAPELESRTEVGPLPVALDGVLDSPGRPLDPATRGFFEPRFGRDFSGVRIHSGSDAQASARALSASAFTIGSHIAFAAGCFSPDRLEGRRLLAHELAHVTQQSASSSGVIRRSPAKPEKRSAETLDDLLLWSTAVWPKTTGFDSEMLMLGANPDHADARWKSLEPKARLAVEKNMERFYGAAFAASFVALHKAGKELGSFEQVGSDTATAGLTARGFHFAGIQAAMNVEIWFDPSGTRLHRVMPREASKPDPAAQAEPTNAQTPPLTPGEKITATFPPTLDPKADREKLFGPTVAFREKSDTGFGKGSMLRYRDGTVELFLEGSTKSIVFRPGPNGLSIIYWEDGKRDKMPWQIPASDFPDPATEPDD